MRRQPRALTLTPALSLKGEGVVIASVAEFARNPGTARAPREGRGASGSCDETNKEGSYSPFASPRGNFSKKTLETSRNVEDGDYVTLHGKF